MRAKIVRVFKYLQRANVPLLAASVSYFAMLASIPLLAVVLTISAKLLPDMHFANAVGLGSVTTAELQNSLARLLPFEATTLIRKEIGRIQSEPPVGLLSMGLVLAVWTASNAYMALLAAMNEIYGVEETRPYWKIRLTAMLMPIMFATILIVALIGIIVAPSVIAFLKLSYFAGSLMSLTQWAVVFAIVVVSFETAYRLGPERLAHHRWLSRGSIVGATMFLIASLLFQTYVRNFGSYDRVYGSLGGFVIFLVWIWMCTLCLLVGCAVNKVLDEEKPVSRQEVRELIGSLD